MYTEDLQTDSYGNITASNAKFVYADRDAGIHKVAHPKITTRGLNPIITDFQIVRDTVYFCGTASFYRRDPSHPLRNSDRGFIGYFCIPDLFNERDGFHILRFEDQTVGINTFCPNYPKRIEAFAVDNGIHIVCSGNWGTSDSTTGNRFVADIVHNYPSGKWWYYVQPEEGTMMTYSDITVTDNYVAAVGPKDAALENLEDPNRSVNGYFFYIQLFHKPTSTSNTPRDINTDQQIFQPRETPSLCQGYFCWQNASFYNDLLIFEPHLTHTGGDFFAVSYLTYARINDQNMYGTTVKHFAVQDILLAFPNSEREREGGVHYTSPDILAPADSPIIPTDILPYVPPIVQPPIPVQPRYNRMVRNQRESDTSAIGRTSRFTLKDVVYNHEYGKILCLQKHDYTLSMLTPEMSVFAFNIHNPAADAIQYHRDDLPVLALSEGNQPNTFCIAGGTSIRGNDNTLTYGLIPLETQDNSCYGKTGRYETYDCGGHLRYDRTGVAPTPKIVKPDVAFSISVFTASVQDATTDDLCE